MQLFTPEWWLEHNGYIVSIEGVDYALQVEYRKAFYPRPAYHLSVHADPIDKTTKEYRETMSRLKDHWSISVLDSPEFMEQVINCLLPSKQPALPYAEVI